MAADESRSPIFDGTKKYVAGKFQQLRNVKDWSRTETDTETVDLHRIIGKTTVNGVDAGQYKLILRDWPAMDVDLDNPSADRGDANYFNLSFHPFNSGPWASGYDFWVEGGAYIDGTLVAAIPGNSGVAEYDESGGVNYDDPVNYILKGVLTASTEDVAGVTYTVDDTNRDFRTLFDLTNGCRIVMTSGGADGQVATISTRNSSTSLTVSGDLTGVASGDSFILYPPAIVAFDGSKGQYLLTWYEDVDDTVDPDLIDPGAGSQVPAWRIEHRWCLYSGFAGVPVGGTGNAIFYAVKVFTLTAGSDISYSSTDIDITEPWKKSILSMETATKLLTNSARRDFYRETEVSPLQPINLVTDLGTSKTLKVKGGTSVVYNHEVNAPTGADLSVARVSEDTLDNAVEVVTGQSVIYADNSVATPVIEMDSITEGQGYVAPAESFPLAAVYAAGSEIFTDSFVMSEPLRIQGMNWSVLDDGFGTDELFVSPGVVRWQGRNYIHPGNTVLDVSLDASWETTAPTGGTPGNLGWGHVVARLDPDTGTVSIVELVRGDRKTMWSGEIENVNNIADGQVYLGSVLYVETAGAAAYVDQYCTNRRYFRQDNAGTDPGFEIGSFSGPAASVPLATLLPSQFQYIEVILRHRNFTDTFSDKNVDIYANPYTRARIIARDSDLTTEVRMELPYGTGAPTFSNVSSEANSIYKVYLTGYTFGEGFIHQKQLWGS